MMITTTVMMNAPKRPNTAFSKVWKACEIGLNAIPAERRNPWGVLESYRTAKDIYARLTRIVQESYGYEHTYLVEALDALRGRMHAQYVYLGDTIGYGAANSDRPINDLRVDAQNKTNNAKKLIDAMEIVA